MSSPLVFGAVLAGGYWLYKKLNPGSNIPKSQGNATGARPGPVVTAPNGVKFQAQTVSTFADGTQMVDIFTTSGSRIVRFQQTGSDKTSRIEIMSPPGVDPAIKAAALSAFGVRPKAA